MSDQTVVHVVLTLLGFPEGAVPGGRFPVEVTRRKLSTETCVLKDAASTGVRKSLAAPRRAHARTQRALATNSRTKKHDHDNEHVHRREDAPTPEPSVLCSGSLCDFST